jgi:hypothetical protein
MLARSQIGQRLVAKAVGRAVDRMADLAYRPARRRRRRAAIEAVLQPAKQLPTIAAKVLVNLVEGGQGQSIAAEAGVRTLRAVGTPEPHFARHGDMLLAIGVTGGRVVPCYALRSCTTDAYLDMRQGEGGALALDWRPGDRTPNGTTAALKFLMALADDRLAFRRGAEELTESGIADLVRRRPMEAVIRAYLADAASERRAVEGLAQAFRAVRDSVPFDLALLADIRDPALVVGRFPLLPAGWRLLPFARLPVHPALAGLAAGLVPAYPFATLEGEAAARFLALIHAGEI